HPIASGLLPRSVRREGGDQSGTFKATERCPQAARFQPALSLLEEGEQFAPSHRMIVQAQKDQAGRMGEWSKGRQLLLLHGHEPPRRAGSVMAASRPKPVVTMRCMVASCSRSTVRPAGVRR